MSRFRVFVKDCLNLNGKVKSNVNCLSFSIKRDLMEKIDSSFVLDIIDENVDIGDVLGLYDEFGTQYYTGVIREINYDNRQIICDSNISYFSYLWLYNALRSLNLSAEELVKKNIENTFINSNDYLMREKYKNIDIILKTTAQTHKLPLKDANYVQDFRDFLFECYKNYGIICDFSVHFGEGNSTLTIDSSAINLDPIKIGDNFNAITNFVVNTETFENNKLTLYNADGTVLRGVWYGSSSGITQDDESVLRLKKINHVIQFSDDDTSLVLAQNLRNEMFNHKITFNLLLDNAMYDFFKDFKLGCPLEIYYEGAFYSTVLTGYELKSDGTNISTVKIICGKLRNTLTSKILQYVR